MGKIYRCKSCGKEFDRELGKCPACGELANTGNSVSDNENEYVISYASSPKNRQVGLIAGIVCVAAIIGVVVFAALSHRSDTVPVLTSEVSINEEPISADVENNQSESFAEKSAVNSSKAESSEISEKSEVSKQKKTESSTQTEQTKSQTSTRESSYSNRSVSRKTIYPTGVSLNSSAVTLKKGETFTLKATIYPSNTTNRSATWSTTNTKVATINGSGKITAQGAGTATITFKTSNGKKAGCTVTVIGDPKKQNSTNKTYSSSPKEDSYEVDFDKEVSFEEESYIEQISDEPDISDPAAVYETSDDNDISTENDVSYNQTTG